VERLFQGYQYGEAGRQIYDFFWSEFADWYIEIAKMQMSGDKDDDATPYTVQTLVWVLDTCLRLLHPFTPFLTEELWTHLKEACLDASPALPTLHSKQGWEEALIVAHWPGPTLEGDWEGQAVANFTVVMEVVRAVRNLRAEKNVTPGRRIPAILVSSSHAGLLREQVIPIANLAYLDQEALTVTETLSTKPEGHIALVVGPVEVYLPLAGLVNVEDEHLRLGKELAEAERQIERLEKLLAGEFTAKAPPVVVEKERGRLAGFIEAAAKLRKQIESL
jgi:valyl-tRNA synthetase